uniref:U3 small nucleolar RNA-associated protein 13 C-terminal domain-containing protein n=1 Tax=Alexandrium monilatum TaxID=311494 RepID=A0A7S4QZD4_9DINO
MVEAEAEAAEEEAEPAGAAPAATPGLSEVWSLEGKHCGCYTGGKVVWSESAKLLGCLNSEELHLVDVATQLPTRQVSQEGDGILAFALDPSGLNVCSTHRSGLLRHFRLGESVSLERAWRAHEELVVDVCFDATGSLVASGSVDHLAKVWDFSGYFCTHSFRGHDAIVSIVRFHPSKLQLVTVASNEVRLWDLQSSKCVGIMQDHLASISSVSFAPIKTGTFQLVSGGHDQVVNIWHLEGKCAVARTVPVFESVEGVVAVGLRGLREAVSEANPREKQFHRWLRTAAKLPAYVIFTVGDKALLRAWNPNDGKCVAEEPSPHGAKGVLRHVLLLAEAANQRLLTIGDDLNLVVWSLPELQVVSYIMGHNDDIVHVQFIPELTWPPESSGGLLKVSTKRFVCITNDEHPRIVNCQGFGAKLLRGHTDMVIACDVSPDGQWIATGGKDQSVRVWSAEEATCACRLSGHTGPVSALSFPKKRPKGPQTGTGQPLQLVSAGQDKIMKVWELPTPAKLRELASGGAEDFMIEKAKAVVVAHSKEVNHVVVSPNNKLIASGGQDKLIRLWKFPQGDLLGECKGHRRGIWCVAFSPVDQVVASASGDATVRLWNLRDYSAIRSFQGHGSAVLRVCFLANGMQLMTSGVDGLLKLWQIRTADCAATYEEHTGKVWCIDVVGQQMVSGGSDSKLCVWRDTTAEHAKEKRDAAAEVAMKDTRIGLLVREGRIEAALTLALDLNRPGQMRQILSNYTMDVVEKCLDRSEEKPASGGGADGAGGGVSGSSGKAGEAAKTVEEEPDLEDNVDLQRWVLSLSTPQLERLMELLEQWNSNRRMASMAQMLMSLVLLALPPSKLAAVEGMNATCGNILSYSSRHMARVDSLLQKTFLFDLVLQSGAFGMTLDGPGATADAKAAKIGKPDRPAAGPGAADALRRTMDVLLGGEDAEKEAGGADDPDESGAEEGGEEAAREELAEEAGEEADLAGGAEGADGEEEEGGGEGTAASKPRKRRRKAAESAGEPGAVGRRKKRR